MIEKLKKLIEIGFTIQSVAEGIGTTRGTVNNWIKGTKQMSPASEVKVINYLDKLRGQLDTIYKM